MTRDNRPEPAAASARQHPRRRVLPPPAGQPARPARLRHRWLAGSRLAIVIALIAALAGALLAPGAAHAAPRPAAPAAGHPGSGTAVPAVPVLAWTGCGRGFQCATAKVPLDYDQPRGRVISIALIRLPAGDPAHRIGSLLVNPGGPGGSGITEVRGDGPFYPAQLRARFDLVGFDPRGVGQSTPVRCFAGQAEQRAFYAGLPAFPVTPAENREYLRTAAEFDRRCGQRNPGLLAHMSTANAARDLDLLRQAVGDAGLSYLGFSYGSYLGTTYASLFPGTVRALVLDGAVEPIQWATGRTRGEARQPVFLRQRSDLASSQTLGEFLAQCATAGPAGCPFAAGNDRTATRHRFQALMTRLRAHPVPVPTPQGTIDIGYAAAVSIVLRSLYFEFVWAPLSDALTQLDQGNGVPVLELARLLAPQTPGYDNGREAQAAVLCADTDGPRDLSGWPRLAAAADRRAPYFGAPWTWISAVCAHWPARDTDRYTGPFNRETANPVLVASTTSDPATPYRNAVALSRELGNARLLTVQGWGHTAFFHSSCARDAEARYLIGLRLPAPGSVCHPDAGPFDQSPPAPAARTLAGTMP